MVKNEILTAALALTPEIRIEVAEALLNSLTPVQSDIEAAWIEESRDRLKAYERGEKTAAPSDEVFSRLGSKYH